MPRIKRIPGPYRFFFTSFDCNEPPHIHVEQEKRRASSGLGLSYWRGIVDSALEN